MSTLFGVKAPIPQKVVKVSDSEGFAVRGLGPMHAVALYRRHSGELEPLFVRIVTGARENGGAKGEDLLALGAAVIGETPYLAAEIIALASGADPASVEDVTIADPDGGDLPLTLPAFDAAVAIARHLPFSVQADALSKIAELTFTSDMPPGKFLALVAKMARQVTGAMQSLNSLALAPNTSGESDAPSVS